MVIVRRTQSWWWTLVLVLADQEHSTTRLLRLELLSYQGLIEPLPNIFFQRWHHTTIPQAGDCLQCWCSGRTDVCQSADLKLTIAPPPQVALVLAKWLRRHQFQHWLGWPPTCRACSSLWRCLAGREQLLDRLMPTISSSPCLLDRGSR